LQPLEKRKKVWGEEALQLRGKLCSLKENEKPLEKRKKVWGEEALQLRESFAALRKK
jgi:hypothetical protein